jgi:DNA repair protein RAD50
MRHDLKELQTLKQQSSNFSDLRHSIARLEAEIARLEESLTSTGSVKTADSVQEELSDLRMKM